MATHTNQALVSKIEQLRILCEESGLGFRFHDDDDSVRRPDGWASVMWLGSVEPVFALDTDTWVDTTT